MTAATVTVINSQNDAVSIAAALAGNVNTNSIVVPVVQSTNHVMFVIYNNT